MYLTAERVEESLNKVFVSTLSQLSCEKYWTEQLWRRVKKYKNYQVMEINNFVYISNLNAAGYWYIPQGCSWASKTDNHEAVLNYLKKFNGISKDYYKWYKEQR